MRLCPRCLTSPLDRVGKSRPVSGPCHQLRPATLPTLRAVALAKTCSASPLNNHTLILYYIIFEFNAARRSGGLSYQRRRFPVIPCSGGSIPVRAINIPCFNLQGICLQDIESNL